ncbi:hypothetical protein JCM33374_g3116 [Metschnikowia sp. JCM 33374]|nr:hypothetical protein JCM33374_g3116 [Metschnikowia sp. JCM 33374]
MSSPKINNGLSVWLENSKDGKMSWTEEIFFSDNNINGFSNSTVPFLVSVMKYGEMKPRSNLARLSGGVAVVKVGGSSEVEGILLGGGTALIQASRILDNVKSKAENSTRSWVIRKSAITKPARRIIDNAGGEGAVIVDKVYDEAEFNRGYDSSKGELTDILVSLEFKI